MRAALWHRLPLNFEAQLDALIRQGFTEFHFDDGYDDIPRAAKALEERGLRGVFFIVPGWLGLDGQAVHADIADLVQGGYGLLGGHEVGNHTMNHPWMARIPLAAQEAEWARADRALTRITGVAPARRAWPYGLAGEGTARGIGRDEVFAPRDRVNFANIYP